jgi:seryl-tRNA synthetase
MQNLNLAVQAHESLRAELLRRWPELIEDPDALEDSLEGLSNLREAIAAVIRSALDDEADCTSIAERIKQLQTRRKRLEDRADRKRALALHFCQEGRLPRIPAPDFTASVSMTKGRVIITGQVDDKWMRIKKEEDKTKIGEALRAGQTVSGAELSNPMPTLVIRTS